MQYQRYNRLKVENDILYGIYKKMMNNIKKKKDV